jgi:hypothetical protein
LIPSSELLASKPRDSTLKREQNSCYEHDNGLNLHLLLQTANVAPGTKRRGTLRSSQGSGTRLCLRDQGRGRSTMSLINMICATR